MNQIKTQLSLKKNKMVNNFGTWLHEAAKQRRPNQGHYYKKVTALGHKDIDDQR